LQGYRVIRGDVDGDGRMECLIRRDDAPGGKPSFLIDCDVDDTTYHPPKQVLDVTTIGYDIETVDTTVSLEDMNQDGRADLVI